MAKLRREHVMIAREMIERSVSIRAVAAQLGVDESTLRYQLARPDDAPDGRRDRPTAVDGWEPVIRGILERFGDRRVVADGPGRCPTHVVHGVLVREFGFPGSYQAVRRHLRRAFGPPPVQAIRRVETPAGVQAQHDWFEWTAVIAGEVCGLAGLIGALSFSRATFVWASRTMTQLAWQAGHLGLFQRYGGVPLWVRHDNLKTAVASGAGPTALFTPAFATSPERAASSGTPAGPAWRATKGRSSAPCEPIVARSPTCSSRGGTPSRRCRARSTCAVRSCTSDGVALSQGPRWRRPWRWSAACCNRCPRCLSRSTAWWRAA